MRNDSEAYRRRTRIYGIIAWTTIGMIVAFTVTVAIVSGIVDVNAKNSCWTAGNLVSEVEHGDGWVCVDKEGRIVR